MIKQMIKTRHNKAKNGFGLIEVLISAAILIVILGALVAIGRMALTNIRVSQERAQATYLAQEGLEVARQIRDTNWVDGLNNTDWNDFMFDGTSYPLDVVKPRQENISIVSDDSVSVKISQSPFVFGKSWTPFYNFDSSDAFEPVTIDGVTYDRCLVLEQTGSLVPSDSSLPANDYRNNNYHSLLIRAKVYWPSNGSCVQASRKMVEATELLTDWRPNF